VSEVLNGSIYIIGGRTSEGVTNEVWRSFDGISWTNIPNPPFAIRLNFSSGVLNNFL